jgi:hypothetical protein
MSSNVTWVNTDPTEGSGASHLDDAVRQMTAAVAYGLGESLNWPGSGGGSATSAGRPKLGSARLAYSDSNRAGGYPDGHLSLDSLRLAVRHVGSTNTGVIGHASMLERAAPSSRSAIWTMQEGVASLDTTDGITPVTFGTIHLGVPHVDVTLSSASFVHGIASPTSSGFTSFASYMDSGVTSATTIYWRSEGTVLRDPV